jgi:PAS domain S-box-containing protein
MQRPQPESVTLNDVLMTEELSRRSPRPPDWRSEAQVMQTLARQMANDSETMLQSLVDIAVELCQAGTAGVSLLETTPDGAEIFRWTVLAGTLSQYVGGTSPRNFSPCGVCLDRGTPQLFSHPERYFTYFQEANTPIVEGLVLPLMAAHYVFGTIWILSHDERRHFDREDVRIMMSLADFMATALLLDRRQTRELLAANTRLEAEIAEREQTEEKLRKAQRRLELSLTGAKFGAWSYNVGTGEFWADERAKRMHGHAAHEVHTFEEAGANIHPQDCERAQTAIAQAIQNHSKLQIEYRVIWKDGSVYWIASYAELMQTGTRNERIFYGVAQDISDRKQVETALRESEERSRALIENLPGGAAFIVDREFRYLLAEGEALSTAGFKPEDLVGRTIFEVLPPELATNYEILYRQALAGKSFEHEHNAHDRSYISRGMPLRSVNGEVYAVLAISYDITDRKQADAARIQLIREQSARFEAERQAR